MTDKRKKRIRELAEKLDVSRRSAANLLDAGRPREVREPGSALTSMPTCLYCHETKDTSAFDREHVVPEAFGTFEGNFVLKDVVCKVCNKYFGDHLDIRLARHSIEGLDRYEHGVKRPKKETGFGRSPHLAARVDEGFYKGAEVWRGASDDGDKLVMC